VSRFFEGLFGMGLLVLVAGLVRLSIAAKWIAVPTRMKIFGWMLLILVPVAGLSTVTKSPARLAYEELISDQRRTARVAEQHAQNIPTINRADVAEVSQQRRSRILYRHHHCHVTQPLLHEQLREWSVDISAGQINAILLDGKAPFHDEKDALLEAGLALSAYVTVDDSGARHPGKNGYVTHIGNQYFASFHSSMSKSRVNFLELLRAGQTDYLITTSALAYSGRFQIPSAGFPDALRSNLIADFAEKAAW